MKKISCAATDVVANELAHARLPFSGMHQSQRMRPTSATVGVLLFIATCLALPSLTQLAAQTRSEKPVAVVGDERIYERDFLPEIESKVYKIRQQEYELKRTALEESIGRKLLRAEAQQRGITEEELLRQAADSTVAEPSDSAVEQRFVLQMFRGTGQVTASKDEIREQMRQEAVQATREEYFLTLREKAGVKIYLLPPALDVDYDRSRVRGHPDARITLVEFSDFQCPYCEQAYTMVKDLLQKYDGKIKLAYRDLPLQEIQSDRNGAGEASRCAGEQGKFWEYHDLLFENQDEYGDKAFEDFAAQLNLNPEQFAACLQSGRFKPLVKRDFDEGIRLGATGTPAFFINGIFVNGARPQREFEEIIDGLIASME